MEKSASRFRRRRLRRAYVGRGLSGARKTRVNHFLRSTLDLHRQCTGLEQWSITSEALAVEERGKYERGKGERRSFYGRDGQTTSHRRPEQEHDVEREQRKIGGKPDRRSRSDSNHPDHQHRERPVGEAVTPEGGDIQSAGYTGGYTNRESQRHHQPIPPGRIRPFPQRAETNRAPMAMAKAKAALQNKVECSDL
jgi:hypothetical protein